MAPPIERVSSAVAAEFEMIRTGRAVPRRARAFGERRRISWKSARSAVIWFEAWPPPCRTAAGWNVGITVRSFQGKR
jgi:hypothetical protein